MPVENDEGEKEMRGWIENRTCSDLTDRTTIAGSTAQYTAVEDNRIYRHENDYQSYRS